MLCFLPSAADKTRAAESACELCPPQLRGHGMEMLSTGTADRASLVEGQKLGACLHPVLLIYVSKMGLFRNATKDYSGCFVWFCFSDQC